MINVTYNTPHNDKAKHLTKKFRVQDLVFSVRITPGLNAKL